MCIFIYVKALFGDTLVPLGGVARKNSDGGTFGNDIIKKFTETSVSIGDILENDRQITLTLTDEGNQSSMKKVTDTILNSD